MFGAAAAMFYCRVAQEGNIGLFLVIAGAAMVVFPPRITVATAQTYDGVRLLLRALDKVGPDPQKIRDALEEIDDFTEAVTKMKPHPFSHANHESLGRDTGFLAVWHDGKLERASE